MPSSMNEHNRRVWSRALEMGLATRSDLERIAGGLVPDELDEDLAELLLQDGLINDDQRAMLAGIADLAETIPIGQEQTIPDHQGLAAERTQILYEEPSLIEETLIEAQEQTETAEPPAEEETETITQSDAQNDSPISGSARTDSTSVTLTDGIRNESSSDVLGSRLATKEDRDRIRHYKQGTSDSLIGVNLNGYRILGRLGAGGMGDVYEAEQLSLHRRVALKVLPMSLAEKQAFRDRFYREARILGSFTHANIVQVYDVDELDGLHYFTMEQVRGKTFKDLITEDGTPVAILTNLMKQSLRGLARAEKAGVIHRDIKPGNLLISDQGDVKIVDFGLAETVAESGEFRSDGVVGTPLYIAPEQVTNQPQTFKTDMYSLGATFYHLSTGRAPYVGKTAMQTTRMHVEERVPDATDVNSSVPKGFADILMKMMAKSPADRYATYKELFDAIEAFEMQTGIIKARTDFLADSLIAIGEHTIRGIWNKIAFMSIVGTAVTLLAIGISVALENNGLHQWKAFAGDIGTILFAVAILFIAYVAMARKRIVPIYGRIQTWMYAHILCALVSYFLVTIHSGNFFKFFVGRGLEMRQYSDRIIPDIVPIIPFLNSFVYLIVIISGLVGATIWRDVLKQVTMEQIQRGEKTGPSDSKLTMSIFSQSVFKYWRIIHYPLAVVLTLLTILHVVSILYYRGM